MHYRNGREAKNGDLVLVIPGYGKPTIGVLHGATAGNDACNGYIAIHAGPQGADLQTCLHLDDVLKALPADLKALPDSSKGG